MSKKFLFLISFVLLVGLAAPAAADELIASYENSEYPDLSISTDPAKDPTLTVTRMLGGTGGAPPATNGDYILKWVWTNETLPLRKIEIRQDWATKTFDLTPYNLITADVWFDGPSAQPATIGTYNYDVNAGWPTGMFWAPALSVPTGTLQWHTVEMDIGGAHGYWDGNDLSCLFAFLFESLAGNSGVIYTDNMWLRFVPQVQAWRPIPFNKAVSMDPNVDLSWEPGILAKSHDVYFGTRFADVNDANRSSVGIFKSNQPLADANYDPGTLKRLTTYYWRIDEVSSGGSPIYKGEVWSFKTAPVKYVEIPLTSYEDSDTRYAVWKGLSIAGDTDASLTLGDKLKGGSTWVNGVTVPTASDGDNVLGLWWNNEADLEVEHGCTFEGSGFTYDLDGIDEMVFDVYYAHNNAEGGFNPLPHVIEVFDWRFVPAHTPSSNLPTTRGEWHTIVIDVSHLKNKGLDSIFDFLFAAHGEDFDPNGADPNNWGALMYMDNLRLRYYVTEFAGGPDPADRATDVDRDADLSWSPGMYAASHDVYFGTTSPPDYNCSKDLADMVFDPGTMLFGTTYYWRVDEVNNAGPDPCFWPGDIWSFTTSNYAVVEDFNSYADDDALWAVWKDYKENGSRAQISLQLGNADANLVRDGNSMKYHYDNYYSFYSEAYATTAALPSGIGSDWTAVGVKALSLYFYGQAGNDANEQMYVRLTDGGIPAKTAKVIYDGDMNDIKKAEWQP
ncbi:MAG: hypothetical protein MUO27_02360, partial [Sedimentisphaerales bacterium]|nr:hypothetical protein [Sedimentisphaerales bacterium]